MAFIDHDEVEKIRRVVTKVRRVARPAHKGLKDGEEDAAVLGHAPLLLDLIGCNPHQRIVRERRERVVGLVGQDVAVCQEQDARPARGLRVRFPVLEVPATLKQLPRQLKGDEGLARAGGQSQQDAVAPVGNGVQRASDRHVLVIAALPGAALVLERHGRKTVAPCIRLGKCQIPQFFRAGVVRRITFGARRHVDAIDGLPIGGVSEAHTQALCIALGLPYALGVGLVPGLGLHHGQFGVAVYQYIVGNVSLGPLGVTLQSAQRDAVLAQDAAAFHHAPASSLEGRVDVFCAGLGFVHGCLSSLGSPESWVRSTAGGLVAIAVTPAYRLFPRVRCSFHTEMWICSDINREGNLEKFSVGIW